MKHSLLFLCACLVLHTSYAQKYASVLEPSITHSNRLSTTTSANKTYNLETFELPSQPSSTALDTTLNKNAIYFDAGAFAILEAVASASLNYERMLAQNKKKNLKFGLRTGIGVYGFYYWGGGSYEVVGAPLTAVVLAGKRSLKFELNVGAALGSATEVNGDDDNGNAEDETGFGAFPIAEIGIRKEKKHFMWRIRAGTTGLGFSLGATF
ncbi:MAG: hypothetical protein ACFB0B_16345 [Thermonemataceae bacterium]